MTLVLVDTGPLVALLNKRDGDHAWVRTILETIEPPLVTCDAVISEASFLMSRVAGGQDALLTLLTNRVVDLDFQLSAELPAVQSLMTKFANVPMALADACLVRMAELERDSVILTLDSDFRIYRRNGRRLIPTIMPDRIGT